MYYKILYCLLALCNSLMLFAQNYNGPESVVYDTMNNRYLISNIHSGQILQRNLSGALSPFVSGLTSPKGMVIKGDTLFVTDVTRVVGFKLNTANQVFNITITGANSLNDITSDQSNNLYISDFAGHRIYQLNIFTQVFTTLVGSGLSSPNGLLYDVHNNRLILCSFIPNCPILGISLPNGNVTTIRSTSIGYLDGLTQDNAGNYYVSGWGANAVFKFDNAFTSPPTPVASGFNGPADIFYDPYNQVLAVPELNGNNVRFIPLVVTNTSNYAFNDIDWDVFPNPTTEILHIKSTENFTNVILYNALGQNIMNIKNNNQHTAAISIAHIMPGIYFMHIFTANGMTAVKKIQIN